MISYPPFWYLADVPDPEPILREAFEDWETGSFFTNLADFVPWDSEETPPAILSMMYFGNHSGGKFCAPLVKLLLNDEGVVDSTKYPLIASILKSKYSIPWSRLWQTNIVAYDPVTNYDMTEDTSRTLSDIGKEVTDIDRSGSVNSTRTPNLTEATTYGRGNQTVDSVQGFNSDDFSNADKTVETSSGTDTTQTTGTETEAEQNTSAEDATKSHDNLEVEGTHTRRKGNIGVTTNQRLVQEERDLWKWNFFEQVFKDIDSELALSYFDPCRV